MGQPPRNRPPQGPRGPRPQGGRPSPRDGGGGRPGPRDGGGGRPGGFQRGGPRPPMCDGDGPLRFYGRHAVEAALGNPNRKKIRLWGLLPALNELTSRLRANVTSMTVPHPDELDRLLLNRAPHQGLVLEVEPLNAPHVEDLVKSADRARPIIVLDQVTDPQNVGAVLRSCAAFDAAALITQDRNGPAETGSLAKAASGALEVVPWLRVVNISRALDQLAEAGYWRIGMAMGGQQLLEDAFPEGPVALVFGSEGDGIRPNVLSHCDAQARLPMSNKVESLNVSTTAAIALYVTSRRALA
jgi:23S rRNA (guanosine2251-2'-O)-methyltransferase